LAQDLRAELQVAPEENSLVPVLGLRYFPKVMSSDIEIDRNYSPANDRPVAAAGSHQFENVSAEDVKRQLFEDGFVALPHLIGLDEVAEVRDIVAHCFERGVQKRAKDIRGVRLSELGDAPEKDGAIVELTNLAILEPTLTETRFFKKAHALSRAILGRGTQPRFDHAIDKQPHSDQPTRWHQDCAYSSRLTLSVRKLHWWLPMHDVNVENGCMHFARGSHNGPYLPHVPVRAGGQSMMTSAPCTADIVACPLAMGGATIHMPKTLHFASPNRSDQRRLAWIVHFGIRSLPPTLL